MATPRFPPSAARSPLVLVAMSLGVLIAQVDTSIVNLAAKRIGADLGSTVSEMQWMLDAYNLVYAALLLTAGTLGDLYGRRRVFVAGVALFALGSVVCAAAPSTAVLLLGRAVSGAGAALEVPMSLVLLALAFPDPQRRRHAFGIWASCNGLAFIVGPTLGGLLVETLGWRSIFYLILPLCVLAVALARAAVQESASPAGRSLDLPGQAAAVAALAGLSFVAIEGPHRGWTAMPVALAAALGVGGAAAFALLERGNPRGLAPFELFRIRAFSTALAGAGLMTFGVYAVAFLVPLYFQTLRGDSPLASAVHMLPLPVSFFIVSSRWNGRIVQAIGARRTMIAGMAALAGGALLMAAVPEGAGIAFAAIALAVTGVGLGLFTAPVNEVAVGSVPPARAGTASGLLNTARMVGATLGVAILGSVFAHFAGQAGEGERFLEGLRIALLLGGAAQLAGAVGLSHFLPREAAAPAARAARRGAD